MALTQVDGGLLSPTNGQFYGMKSRIINGAMVIDQRNAGASVTITGGASTLAFNCDRWQVRSAGSNATVQQVNTNNLYRMVFTGLASNSAVAASQSIEAVNCADFAGQTATLSLTAKSTSLTSLTLEAYYANTNNTFGTWGSPTVTSIGTQAVTISTTESTVSWTFAVPSAATTGIQIRITGGALLASQTLTIGSVQLEKGSTATSFDYRPYGTELALCQRYLPAVKATAINEIFGNHYNANATIARGVIPFQVTPRVSPTGATFSAASDFYASSNVNMTASSIVFYAGAANAGSIQLTGAGGQTTGQGGLICAATANAQILFTGCEL